MAGGVRGFTVGYFGTGGFASGSRSPHWGYYVPVAMEVPYGEAIDGDVISDDDEVVVGGVELVGFDVGTAGDKDVIQVGAVGVYGGP